ncbi:PVC-type heme-binding CxxCH protein [Dyadobacter jiangsuensis]|uniref:Putative membrane-bound dehydrogenase-like protein n=1 Tax=Dyadobacter jiangsuensis TaxID=1591085 RepID=A0A2P8FNJ1_9BACT|nr:PVC-type heme-binding CxxCH protein [Dyadobacter jiangsuensis]PSL23225.1 putative membrane-bound dehydrogenase-like protein [Dyadobacter jiangsuensis]
MTQLKTLAVSVLTLLSFHTIAQKRYTNALSPAESARTFQLREEFSIEPFVTEPEVLSPVDLVFDASGNAFVVEMGDYPYDAQPGRFKGRIRLLKDTNGDGKIDKSYVFADGLPSATSVLPYKDGLIVCAAPDILLLRDTNGDFKADTREVLFTGFFAKNSEAQITSMRYGVDNWIYANNSGQAGMITSPLRPDMPPLNVAGGNFRFRLDKKLFEVESGNGQFGLAMDEWGHRFYTQNTLHIQQSPIAWRYLHRHNYLPSFRSDVNISDHELEMFQKTATPYWRQQRSDRRQAKYDSLKTGFTEYARDHFTGASGGTFFGGDGFPEAFKGNVFTGEVAGNLVHRDVLKTVDGSPAFTATRDAGEKDREFLASTDPWFRPANLTTGPDGYLYVVDMYRQHIETPVSIPEDLKKDMDFANGEQYGRIWRIFPKEGEKRPAALPDLRTKTAAELGGLLEHPNQWWRLNAQRILVEKYSWKSGSDYNLIQKQEKTILPDLIKMTEHADPRTRLHAIYTLEALDGLNETIVKKALYDVHAGVREHAVILAEKYPSLLPEIIRLTDDLTPQVAYQAALSTGQFNGKEALAALAGIAEKQSENASWRLAVLSSDGGSSPEMGQLLVSRGNFFNAAAPGKLKLVEDLGYIAGARNGKNDVASLLELVNSPAVSADPQWAAAALTGISKGVKKLTNKREAEKQVSKHLQKLENHSSDAVRKQATELKKALNIN